MKTTKTTIPLKELKGTFDIFIPHTVETKIRLYCKHITEVEWSGVLFYKVEGNFKDKNIRIVCLDICPMDIGTAGYTEYKVSPEVSTYMVDNPDLLEPGVYQGLIHSHNNMAAFFSGTDINTLQSEGLDMPHFVSLIVNNKGVYVAAMTRQTIIKQVVNQTRHFQTWEGKNTQIQEVYNIEQQQLERINLNIKHEYEEEENTIVGLLDDIRKRIDEEKKAEAIYKANHWSGNNYFNNMYGSMANTHTGYNPLYKEVEKEQKEDDSLETYKAKVIANNQDKLFKEEDTKVESKVVIEEEEEDPLYNYLDTVVVDKKYIDDALLKLLYCSAIIPIKHLSIKELIKNSEKRFKESFGTIHNFGYFASNFIEFLVNDVPQSILDQVEQNATAASAIYAYHILTELEEYKENKWLSAYADQINNYI